MDSQYYTPPQFPPPRHSPWEKVKKFFAPLAVVGVLLAKFKFVLIPVLKFLPIILKTGGSMFFFMWIYSMRYGWQFAIGFSLLIFVHECGHLVAAKRLGLKVGAPVFIPFMGAIIALKEAPRNAWVEAQVGIGGPLLGSVGAAFCLGFYKITGHPMYAALALMGFSLNLFNLAPIGFLDGGRIVTAISPWLWLVGIVIIGLMLITHYDNFLLVLIFIFSLPRAFSLFRAKSDVERRYFEVTSAQRLTMAVLYFGLAAALAYGMHLTNTILQFDHPRPEAHPGHQVI